MYHFKHLFFAFLTGVFCSSLFFIANSAEAYTGSQNWDSAPTPGTNITNAIFGDWDQSTQGTGSCLTSFFVALSSPYSMDCENRAGRYGLAAFTTGVHFQGYIQRSSGTANAEFGLAESHDRSDSIYIRYAGDGSLDIVSAGINCTAENDVYVAGTVPISGSWEKFTIISSILNDEIYFYHFNTLIFTSTCDPGQVDALDELAIDDGGSNVYFDNLSWATDNDVPLPPTIIDTATRIIDVPSPGDGAITASTTVSFITNYLSNFPVASEICFELQNLTTNQSLNPLCEVVNQSGILNFSTSTILISTNWYRLRTVIYDEEGIMIDQELDSFHVLNNPFVTWETPPNSIASTTFNNPEDANIPDWLSQILNIDNALVNKHPWAWVIDFGQILYTKTNQAPADVSAPLLVLDFAISNTSTSSIFHVDVDTDDLEMDVFSSSTVGQLMPIDTIRELIRFALWLLFMFYLFYAVKNIFNRA